MNNLTKLITLCVFILFYGCDCHDCDMKLYPVKATFYYINNTSSVITNDFIENVDDINVGDTLVIFEDKILEQTLLPNIDTYSPSINTRTFFYKEGEDLKCEFGARDILNYEVRKEVSPQVFEFTFRFTEEKRELAQVCN